MRKYMHKQRILVKQIWFLDRQDEKKRISLTMRTRGGQCLTMKEVAKHLSHVCGCRMVPSQDSKAVLNSEWRTVLFCEDVNYKVLYGVARVTKERETISGDMPVQPQMNSLRCVFRMGWGPVWRRVRKVKLW